ncbi:MAG: hypothetical protein D6797_02100 [Bdellovibrio sp.]|nr:MAG: hypothetical protein D6797_02100 [Bdellovibrio sp.]
MFSKGYKIFGVTKMGLFFSYLSHFETLSTNVWANRLFVTICFKKEAFYCSQDKCLAIFKKLCFINNIQIKGAYHNDTEISELYSSAQSL